MDGRPDIVRQFEAKQACVENELSHGARFKEMR